jgi:hypothetical protein
MRANASQAHVNTSMKSTRTSSQGHPLAARELRRIETPSRNPRRLAYITSVVLVGWAKIANFLTPPSWQEGS